MTASHSDERQLPRRYGRALTACVLAGFVGLVLFAIGIGGGVAQMWGEVSWLVWVGLGLCVASGVTFYFVYRRASHLLATFDLEAPCAWSDLASNLRWVAIHMIEETARHAGHADIIRETIERDRGERNGAPHLPPGMAVAAAASCTALRTPPRAAA